MEVIFCPVTSKGEWVISMKVCLRYPLDMHLLTALKSTPADQAWTERAHVHVHVGIYACDCTRVVEEAVEKIIDVEEGKRFPQE